MGSAEIAADVEWSGTNRLLPHFERSLGRFKGEGTAEPEWNVPFSAFRWRDAPHAGVDVLVSFGLARHLLADRRQELLLALRRAWEDVALSILVSIGAYLLERHIPLGVGETVRVPPELETPVDTLVVSSADELVSGLGVCGDYDPPIEVVWLVPRGGRDRFDLGLRQTP